MWSRDPSPPITAHLTGVEGLELADTRDEAELLFTGVAALSSAGPRSTLSRLLLLQQESCQLLCDIRLKLNN